MKNRTFTVLLYKEDDTYIAECPEVETVDQGETIEQAIAVLRLGNWHQQRNHPRHFFTIFTRLF
jgi:hypothetical protein